MAEALWPRPTLRHVRRLTDDCGIIQHAKFWLPDYATGYCVDDNARALITAVRMHRLLDDASAHALVVRYQAFLFYAQRRDGQMRNFVDYTRTFLEETGSPDSLGRAIWGLGHASTYDEVYLSIPAREMFHRALPHLTPLSPPHAQAYGILGLCAYGEHEALREEAQRLVRPAAGMLLELYRDNRTPAWDWFLPVLTYGNARLAQALLRAGRLLDSTELIDAGLSSLDFLNRVCFPGDVLEVVGCHGWYPRGGKCARYDQQPIDAGAMVEANLDAYSLSREARFLARAVRAMGWFFGENTQGAPLYDTQSGGCHDGLLAQGVNANQGAESTVAYLMALLRLYEVQPHRFEPEELPSLEVDEVRG
jgi:hypothetical protein